MPKLIVQTPDGQEAAYEFDEPVITIGRSEGNSIVIPHSSLSGMHAQLTLNPDGTYTITDPGSTNGTFVNGEHVTEAILPPYANIVFGQVSSNFYTIEPSAPSGITRRGFELPTLPAKGRPANFVSVSPFPKHRKKSDPSGAIAAFLTVTSILASLGLVGAVFSLLQSQ
jgi:hypothetical protein